VQARHRSEYSGLETTLQKTFRRQEYGHRIQRDVVGGLFQVNNKNSASGHGRDLQVQLELDIKNEVTIHDIEDQDAQIDNEARTRSYLWPTASAASLLKTYDSSAFSAITGICY